MPTRPAAAPKSGIGDDAIFELRWERAKDDLHAPLSRLYGKVVPVDNLMDRVRMLLRRQWMARPADLRLLDLKRDIDPDWFQSSRMAGYVFYADRFGGTLKGVGDRIPYLRDLGVTYAHFMPCLMPRPGDSDGGYAVMDYTRIDPKLGTMADFKRLTKKMRAAGISPCIDMVLNHTAREHDWAERARAGDSFYQEFYRLYDEPEIPLAFEKTLLEVFPEQAPGNFTYDETMGKWVWTTFNTFQWDLNWENPEVFLAILEVILTLANAGAEVLRLDAVAFMWKRMGTVCQNEPEVHDILQALNQAASVAAAATIFKAEAIVGPDQLVPYLGTGRHTGKVCNLAYHNSLMVQFWSALASRETHLMTDVLKRHFPDRFVGAEWATYIRCHDDIGWAITEEDAERHGVTGPGHRKFLSDFYAGRFENSFARGADFQVNEATGDARTNGSFASLAGLEDAIEKKDADAIYRAIARITLGHALIAGFGGIPLVYMGDELGLLNDATFRNDPDLAGDGRWMQRPRMDWGLATDAPESDAPHGRIYRAVRHILATRAACPELGGKTASQVIETGHGRLFCVLRPGTDVATWIVANMSEEEQIIARDALGLPAGPVPLDALTGLQPHLAGDAIVVPALTCLWLRHPLW
ncbi:alpha-amylase family protein [Palleronia sp. LCG004]|uniref:alpha-amylase family protein n=1 Tax=Palleronia sp. LCG004 TaxID=3079304 RepID=UPI002943D7AA|nr:alpha-amylase family protein [Palleronia sp. LCG004]WOI57380.1 alpha-amylase family protein [Palleronia sp. LCG004]